MNTRTKQTLSILILSASYNTVYSLLYMKGLYYDLMRSGLSLTHFHLGQLYSVYGLCAMFSYLCGVWFLNRFRYHQLICGSLLFVAIVPLLLMIVKSYPVMLVLFGFTGFVLGSAFYPAHLEILHYLGSVRSQGGVFSMFFIGNSIFGILFACLGSLISSIPRNATQKIHWLFLFFCLLNVIMAILSYLSLRPYSAIQKEPARLSPEFLFAIIRNKKLWLAILIIMCNYILFASQNYMIPYMNTLFSLSPQLTSVLSIIRTYLIAIPASWLAGKITDYLEFSSRLLLYTFCCFIFAMLFMLLFGTEFLPAAVLFLFAACLFINMGKSMSLITIDETGIPLKFYGLAVSIVSFLAYSPDAYYFSFSGWMLDSFPLYGYQGVFVITILFAVIGIAAAVLLQHKEE